MVQIMSKVCNKQSQARRGTMNPNAQIFQKATHEPHNNVEEVSTSENIGTGSQQQAQTQAQSGHNYPCLIYCLKIPSSNGENVATTNTIMRHDQQAVAHRVEGSILMRQLQNPPIINNKLVNRPSAALEYTNVSANEPSSSSVGFDHNVTFESSPSPSSLFIHDESSGLDLPILEDLEILDVVGLGDDSRDDPFAQFNDDEIDNNQPPPPPQPDSSSIDNHSTTKGGYMHISQIQPTTIPHSGTDFGGMYTVEANGTPMRRRGGSRKGRGGKSSTSKPLTPRRRSLPKCCGVPAKRGRKPKPKVSVAPHFPGFPPTAPHPPTPASGILTNGNPTFQGIGSCCAGLSSQLGQIGSWTIGPSTYPGLKMPLAHHHNHSVPPSQEQPMNTHTHAPIVFIRGKWILGRFRCELCGIIEGTSVEMNNHRWYHPYEKCTFLEIHPVTGIPFLRHECTYIPGFEKHNSK